MNNLGKANVKVEILKSLPGIVKDPTEFNFEVTGSQWDYILNSPYFPPVLSEYIIDNRDGFGAIFPTRRKFYVDNYIGAGYLQPPAAAQAQGGFDIQWTSINDYSNRGLVTEIANTYPSYTLMQPGFYTLDYKGPEWDMIGEPLPPNPDDRQLLLQWAKSLVRPPAASDSSYLYNLINDNAAVNQNSAGYVSWIHQQKALDGLWWGIESNKFLPVITSAVTGEALTSLPFCVNIRILGRPPAKSLYTSSTTTYSPGQAVNPNAIIPNYETQFIISLGDDDTLNQFDIVLKQNAKPYIVDYTMGRHSSGGSSSIGSTIIVKEFDEDLSKLWDTQEEIEVMVMTIAGRLVVWVNKMCLIYTRVNKESGDNAGKIKECKIASGNIKIFGSNVQAKINVCPLTFSPFGVFAMPLPSVINAPNSDPTTIGWHGVTNRGNIQGAVCVLPKQPDQQGKLYGVDCGVFQQVSAVSMDGSGPIAPVTEYPNGFAFHEMGKIFFINAGAAGITIFPNSDFYIVAMQCYIDSTLIYIPSTTDAANVASIKNWGCPFYFRLKGGYRHNSNIIFPDVIEPEVISVTQSISAPDYFHALSNANVVIYNKNGEYDYLKEKQYGIRISWRWNDDEEVQTFVGVIVNTSTSEVPGKETMTLQCEDYMFILKNTPIINSPFYDGMVAFFAIADLAKRGGVQTCINDIVSSDDYFLPSGYTFSKPAVRFPSSNMLFNCITDLVKRFEVFVYFDGLGQFHVFGLPGGLFSDTTTEPILAEFKRDPDQIDPTRIILNERNVEYNFASTANEISVLSVERDSRNAILYSKAAATTGEDHLMYKKVYLYNQAAFGELEAVRTWCNRLSKRIFYPIRKTSFQTVGSNDADQNRILGFIKVDGLEYRVMSISHKYNADSNDFTTEYNVEWLGGR